MGEDLIILGWTILKIAIVMVILLLSVAYLTLAERKVIGYIQGRIGPNRVGPRGLLQPIADVGKLLTKEVILPTQASLGLFLIAPLITLVLAFVGWAVIPVSDWMVLSNINLGLLYIFAVSSLGVYGVIIAGWASNSKYALFGSLRSAAQTISYEIAMGFALIGVMMCANSLNLTQIVMAQSGSPLHWFWLPCLPLFVVYWISGVAETNRAPFDVAEGESEIVAGFHVEYSGIGFALFFLAEYANMILISILAALMFLGGWLSPFESLPSINQYLLWVPAPAWLLIKTSLFLFMYLWFRATFPRYRYDQIMRLGWKVLIPVTIVWIAVLAVMIQMQVGPWFN